MKLNRTEFHFYIFLTSLVLMGCSEGFKASNSNKLSGSSSLPKIILNCSSNGVTYEAGASVTGYPISSVVYPTLCGTQVTRVCETNGEFNGAMPLYNTCTQQCLDPETNQAMTAGSVYYSFTKATGATQSECDSNKVTSICMSSTGTYLPTPPTVKFKTCAVAGQTCAYTTGMGINSPTGNMTGSTATGYGANAATYPTLCGATATVTCQSNGSWTGSTPRYTSCIQKCIHPVTATPADQGTTYTYYTLSTGTQAQCDGAKVTSTCSASTGLFAPAVATTRYASCSVALPPPVLLGRALYDSKCMNCHGQFDVSTLKSKIVTEALINSGLSTISAMSSLKGTLTTAQITSLVDLFKPTTTTPPVVSTFSCTDAQAEKQSSVKMVRLTGTELRNTYSSILSTSIWSALASKYYLIPVDSFDTSISNFSGSYTQDNVEQISQFNELISEQLVLNNTNISSFFGSCASTTAFTKTCFDTFLTSKGPIILRGALDPTDNADIWTILSQASAIPDKLKTLAQIMFNNPRFLYHVETGISGPDAAGLITLSSYEVASRISYGMTQAPPDATLLAAAQSDSLRTLAGITPHIDRLAKTAQFKNRVIELTKFYIGVASPGVAPTITEFLNGINGANLEVAITDEFNEYINYVVFTKNGTLNDLFTSQAAFPKTTPLASILGTSTWSSGNPMIAPNHAGILSKPYFFLVSNPNLKLVQRGKKIRVNMLCTDIPQPSAADLAARPELSSADLINLNRRDYINKATNVLPGVTTGACYACHSKMNQMGFSTENYDSLGRYITTEKIYDTNNVKVAEHPVISSSTPSINDSDTRTFSNINEFQVALAHSDDLHRCFSRKTFQFFQRQVETVSLDSCRLNKMDNVLKADQPLLNFFLENFKQNSMFFKRN